MGRLARIAQELKKNWTEVRAEREGVGLSKARRLKSLDELDPTARLAVEKGAHVSRPTNIVIKMHDQTPMLYFNDGSLRRLQSKKLSRSLKKALKRKRSEVNAQAQS